MKKALVDRWTMRQEEKENNEVSQISVGRTYSRICKKSPFE